MDDFADNGSLLLYICKCTNGYLAAQALCFEFLETSEERRGKSGTVSYTHLQFSGVPLVRLYLYFFLLSFSFIRHHDNGSCRHDSGIRRRGSDNRLRDCGRDNDIRLLHNNSRHRLVRYSLLRCPLRHFHPAGYISHREGLSLIHI